MHRNNSPSFAPLSSPLLKVGAKVWVQHRRQIAKPEFTKGGNEMISMEVYVRQWRHKLRRLLLDPRLHTWGRAAGYLLGGFCLSAASLGNQAMPLALGLVCACSGWGAVLATAGGVLGYRIFWGLAGQQMALWLLVGMAASVLLVDRRISRETPFLMPAITGLIVAATGVIFQTALQQSAPVEIYLLRILLAAASTWLFTQVLRSRNPIADWFACSLGVLALAQIAPVLWLNFGYIGAAALTVAGAFPGAALAGLALDLAQITTVPMTAVLSLAFFLRLVPSRGRQLRKLGPGLIFLAVMQLSGSWDVLPLPGLLIGGLVGGFLPGPGKTTHRRGETGVAQVRLELTAGVLAQTEQLLLEAPEVPVDQDALVTRAAEQACNGCPCRKNCKDMNRICLLPGHLLHKPLLTPEELPIICRKSGRFLAQLHRSQEQLRSIRADRERQREYREALIQQYRFLAEYLQELSDQLGRRGESPQPVYEPVVTVCGNRPEADNGDRCLRFSGTGSKYYVLLCDGMGTGIGAVQEGKTAGNLLKRLLSAGFPAQYALRSLNSLCALRERAGAVTIDLLELDLAVGKGTLYKWGAAPSYLVSRAAAEKLGTVGAPPGLSVTDQQEMTQRLSMRRGEILLLVSDGVPEQEALRCCATGLGQEPETIARQIIAGTRQTGQDDATVAAVTLR